MGITRYDVRKNTDFSSDFELLYISKSKFENDWHSTAHFHPFTEIFFITNGSGDFHLDANVVNVSKGDLIIINPNCLHTEKSNITNDPLEYIVFGINNLSLIHHGSPTLVNSDDIKKSDLYRVINSDDLGIYSKLIDPLLINEIENKSSNYELVCKSLVTLIIVFISRRESNDVALKKVSKKQLNLECMKIKNYLDSHYSENITLDKLASMSHVNKYYVVHSFTKQIGVSPINYVINKRIAEAKNLLKTTNYSIRDISSIVGFSTSSYFSQMFKKVTGFSPKEYKIQIK